MNIQQQLKTQVLDNMRNMKQLQIKGNYSFQSLIVKGLQLLILHHLGDSLIMKVVLRFYIKNLFIFRQ